MRDPRLLACVAVALLEIVTPTHAACNIVDGKAYGDCAGVRINEGIKGHLNIRSYTSETGIIGGATVVRGGDLALSGIANGDITVQKGAHLILTGIVNGTVNNLGGNVEIEGILEHLQSTGGQVLVGGTVGRVSGLGPVRYKNGAVVGAVPFEKAVRKAGKL